MSPWEAIRLYTIDLFLARHVCVTKSIIVNYELSFPGQRLHDCIYPDISFGEEEAELFLQHFMFVSEVKFTVWLDLVANSAELI